MRIEKVIRNGQVGVLVSPDYGAGFLTWGAPLEAIFNPTLIELVESKKLDEAIEFVETTWPGLYTGGVSSLRVVWLDEGTQFRIDEYDGAEWIEILNEVNWITA